MLLEIIEPHTTGDPMNSDKWLNCRLRDIQEKLGEHSVSLPVISRILRAHDYCLRANEKELSAGSQHPDRDDQFVHILEQREQHQAEGQPTISVDTKKKELIGNFKNSGRIWCQNTELVNVHDFKQDAVGKAVPYGIYDDLYNQGTVYLGCSSDTPTFAVDNIAEWYATEGMQRYPNATKLLIEADSGGSNSARSRVWKQQLQEQLADRFGLTLTVCHYPTGTSKWNPIEHRLFSEISKTWAGCPLRSFEIALDYIRDTKTETGLSVSAHLNNKEYKIGIKVSDEDMQMLNLIYHAVCPQWNYTIYPRMVSSIKL